MKLLSIIIPFYNSEHKCTRLLESLKNINDSEVEIVCVDDGSTDNTVNLIKNFKKDVNFHVHIIEQENKGPGGARNTGLEVSQGKYIWFVDSDDDIDLNTALVILRQNDILDFDFIDFNIKSDNKNINSMELTPGVYNTAVTQLLITKFGRICTKIFNNRVFKNTGLRYPEYCIYEDNPVVFILPFCINKFMKSESCVYSHNEEYDSVTRGNRSDRYYDRMITACYGYSVGSNIAKNEEIKLIMQKHFIRLYVVNTGTLTKFPSKYWIERLRIMRKFRQDAKILGINTSLFNISQNLKTVSFKFKIIFIPLYLTSIIMPDQNKFFENKRINAWSRPFKAPLTFNIDC